MNTALDGFEFPRVMSNADILAVKDVSLLIPPYESLPEDFRNGNQWTTEVETWFFSGLAHDTPIQVKASIDRETAIRHLWAILCGVRPVHARRMACAGYLLSQWFDSFGNAKKA